MSLTQSLKFDDDDLSSPSFGIFGNISYVRTPCRAHRGAVAEWLARRLLNLLFTGSNTGGATWSTRNNLE